MKYIALSLGLFVLTTAIHPVQAIVAEEYAGQIVRDSKTNVDWYVHPGTLERYKVSGGKAVLNMMIQLSKGITNADLERIPQSKTNTNNLALRQRLAGYIYLQIESNGEAWYVNPIDLKRYYLASGEAGYATLKALHQTVPHSTVKQIQIEDSYQPAGATGDATTSTYSINTARGAFSITLIKIPRGSYELVTDTANTSDCTSNCAAKSLAQYVSENDAEGGMHGTYFCPPDYGSCAGQTNSFLPPWYNTAADVMINSAKLPYHSGPMIVQGVDEQVYYYHRTKDFGYTVDEFEQDKQTLVKAAVGSYPALVEGGNVMVDSEPLDSKQRDVKSNRGGIGYDRNYFYMVTARSATVVDLAYIFDALAVDYAINLDGGGSTAMYAKGAYLMGPGRALPNAVVYRKL